MKRDPKKTARNKEILDYKEQLRTLLPTVLAKTSFPSEANLNAFIGGKTGNLIDLKKERIESCDHYISLWLEGLEDRIRNNDTQQNYQSLASAIKSIDCFRDYVLIFLKRSYLKNCEALSRPRPTENESFYWFGLNDQDYGLFITPRFNGSDWENDKSEERSLPAEYWTLGHILVSGFVGPNSEDIVWFSDIDQLLTFYRIVLVRSTRSVYQKRIAELYTNFVQQSDNPESILFLFPELRYGGKNTRHKYRLDFSLINIQSQEKVGFELSPWSTHGYISKTAELTQKEINDQAASNFQKEIEKIRDYYEAFNITTLTFSDRDLENIELIFSQFIAPRLVVKKPSTTIDYGLFRKYKFKGV